MAATIIPLLVIFFEAVCSMIFFDYFLDRRPARINLPQNLGITFSIFLICLGIVFLLNNPNSIIITALKMGSVVAGYVLVLSIFYKGMLIKKIVIAVVMFAMGYFMDYFSIVVFEIISQGNQSSNIASPIYGVLLLIISKLLLFILVNIVGKVSSKIISKNYNSNNYLHWLSTIILPIISIISCSVLFQLSDSRNHTNPFFVLIILGWMFICIAWFFMIKKIDEKEAILRDSYRIQQKLEGEMRSLKTISIVNSKTKTIAHDFQNHILCLARLMDENKWEAAAEYANAISDSSRQTISHVVTQNEVVDALLNSKYLLAADKGIHLYPIVSELSDLVIKDDDLIAILANLIDNAIEACDKVPDDRVIQLKLVKEERNLILSVKNPVIARVDVVNNDIKTTKQNASMHGIGINSIKSILDKYQGSYAIKCDENFFRFSILIPLGA